MIVLCERFKYSQVFYSREKAIPGRGVRVSPFFLVAPQWGRGIYSGNSLAWLEVAFFLGEDTAAVLLDIHTQLTGSVLSCAEIRTEIPIEEFYTEFRRRPFCPKPDS